MKTKLIRNFVLVTLTLLLTPGLIQTTYASVTGPGPSWLFVRQITLSPVTPSANFQVKVTLVTGQYTNMNATGNDLRFYDINNNSCNYWIETWNNAGTSTIWVKVPTSGAAALYMYYGNGSASAASNGANVFDFFDDFLGSVLAANWSANASGGSINVANSQVTLSNTNAGTVSISSPFTPSSTSFLIEEMHHAGAYNRNRFYATTVLNGGSPTGFDYGYFALGSPLIYWNGISGSAVTAATNYLSRWQITDGSTYNWSNYIYSTMAQIDVTRSTSVASNIRYISFQVTEFAGTSTIVDWVRVRKFTATEPVATVGSQLSNISASITAQTNVLCNGQSTGAATVTGTGGATPYSYLWSNAQTTQTATGLPAGTFTVTVTDNIGLTTTASVTITQLVASIASVTSQSNITCFAANDGTITVSASGGTGPYTFSVDNGSNWLPPTGTNLRLFTGLIPNNPYRIKVKDNNGCISK